VADNLIDATLPALPEVVADMVCLQRFSEDDIQQAFETGNACFAQDEGDIYTPAITLWAFLSQVLHAQRLRSCTAAVSRVIVLCVAIGRQPPSPDTGAYCRARTKLPERVLSRLVYGLAAAAELDG
jgi:hypothetical protein